MRIPCSSSKRYLSGMDWIIGMFDRMLKKTTGAGNASHLILELDGPLDEQRFRDEIAAFARAFPVLGGTVRRDVNLAPYWKIPLVLPDPPPVATCVASDPVPANGVPDTLADRVNDPFPRPTDHVAFHIARAHDSRTWLGMVFDHRLFDARGAEGFLALFETWRAQRDIGAIAKSLKLTAPAGLDHWTRKFKAGQTVNRALLRVAPFARHRMTASPLRDKRARFCFLAFSEDETRVIEDLAHKEAGFLMISPFLLSCSLQALHKTLARTGRELPAYVAPVSIDMRKPGAWRTDLFFNHVSFLFFAAQADIMDNRPALAQNLAEQFYAQKKDGVPESYPEAAMLMRIMPLPLLARLAHLPFRGEFGALSFAHLGDSILTGPAFMDRPLLNVRHAPRIPVPPGLGFAFNKAGNRLNATISYYPHLLDPDDISDIEQSLRHIPASGGRPDAPATQRS